MDSYVLLEVMLEFECLSTLVAFKSSQNLVVQLLLIPDAHLKRLGLLSQEFFKFNRRHNRFFIVTNA